MAFALDLSNVDKATLGEPTWLAFYCQVESTRRVHKYQLSDSLVLMPVFKDILSVVNFNTFDDKNKPQILEEYPGRANKSVFFFVLSAYPNFDRRSACRLTWLSTLANRPNVDYKFFLNTPNEADTFGKVQGEKMIFEDLVISETTKGFGKDANHFNQWLWEVVEYLIKNFQGFDYYILVHDDSYVCTDHLIYDMQFWPKTSDMFVSHFYEGRADCTMVCGHEFLMKSYAAVQKDASNRQLIWDTMLQQAVLLPSETQIFHDMRHFYGASGFDNKRQNDWHNGWVGIDLMTRQEKLEFCMKGLSLHQAYPMLMYDLFNHTQQHAHMHAHSIEGLYEDANMTRLNNF